MGTGEWPPCVVLNDFGEFVDFSLTTMVCCWPLVWQLS